MDILSFKAAHKSVTINAHYLGFDPEKKVRCDERRVMQVLMNLLSNALKFTSTNGRIEIRVRLLRGQNSAFLEQEIHPELAKYHDDDADMLEVAVTDNGAGIKEVDLPKLFQLYGFIKETREINTRGIGLGLYICRKIVRQLGGEIVCESIWGKGSKFTFLVKL